MSSPSVEDRGSVSAFVACMASCLAVCSLFVLEHGRFATEYVRVSDAAENAARIACQNITGIREGRPRVDAVAARRTAMEYLSEERIVGSVTLTPSGDVQIRARSTVHTLFLSRLGVGARLIDVVRTARWADG